MAEVHILVLIEENPEITGTEVTLEWNRAKRAISQTITKLENRELIKLIYYHSKVNISKF